MNDANKFGNAVAYEGYMGRWSRLVAAQFLAWLNIPQSSTWLDVGAGTGILTKAILEQDTPRQVVAIDLSEQYLDYARQVISDARVEFKVGDASQLALELPPFDVAVAGLVLNFVPSAPAAVQGMRDAIKPGGTIAAYVWDYGNQMQMMRHFWEAAEAVDPAAREFEAGTQYSLCNPQSLQALFVDAGLQHVEAAPIDIPTRFQNFADFWQPFLAAQGSVSKYLRSVDDDRREAIQQQLRQQLPINADESIDLSARAWAVKGKKIP